MNRALNLSRIQPFTAYDEMHVNAGKHLGIGFRALRLDMGDTIHHLLARLIEDIHNIKRGAPAHTDQHDFHRPRATVAPARVRRAVHKHGLAAFVLAGEAYAAGPFNGYFHIPNNSCNFFPGSGAVINASPTRNACAPCRRRRATSSGVWMPLSVMTMRSLGT